MTREEQRSKTPDEAIGSIRIAAPYNPIPENYTIPNLRIRAHFIYQMHTLKIR